MRKTETLLIGGALVTAIVVTSAAFIKCAGDGAGVGAHEYPAGRYGSFLAAQHAVYVNDFARAADFSHDFADVDYRVVKNTRMVSEFLDGKMPADAGNLKDEKNMPASLIYDAYLLQNDDWKSLYARHKNDESALAAPMRIWAAVGAGRVSDAIKFIDKVQANTSWKNFMRGQIYAQTGDADAAAAAFAAVSPDFMNISDFLYVMSFYRAHGMAVAADTLRDEFTSRPGGMFMLDYDDVPDWESFAGFKNALAFSFIQNVSHTQILMYSDLAMLLMRFAQIVGPAYDGQNDAINYYMGQYFYNNAGNWRDYFDKIGEKSPYYPFVVIKAAEKTDDMRSVERMSRAMPLFVPASNRLISYYISNGRRADALRTVNRALENSRLTESGRAFFLKNRAQVYYMFGDYDRAQADIRAFSDIVPIDGEATALQAKIWAAQKRELDAAYDKAMSLVKSNPADVFAWDTVGVVVAVRDGVDDALELLSRIAAISTSCSSLFEHLGDLYVARGEKQLALDAYNRALELSSDGLTVAPYLRKKIRKLK